MGRLLLIAVLLIIYGSLYPFEFHPNNGPGPLWLLAHGWPTSLDPFVIKDAILNLLLYLPVGMFGSLWIGKGRLSAREATLTLALGMTLSACMEILQAYDGTRSCGGIDLAMNTASTAAGILLARLYRKAIGRLVSRPEMRTAFHSSGALFLLLSWVLFQTFPFFPALSGSVLHLKLDTLWHTINLPLPETAAQAADWLAVAKLFEVLFGVVSSRRFLPLFWAFLLARLVISGRTLLWPEIVGAILAWLIWTCWLWSRQNRGLVLAWLSVVMLIVRGLAPYSWSATPVKFSWIPFGSSLGYTYGLSLIPFLDKAFLYGTAVWLFREAGFGYVRPVLGLSVLLGAIEVLQTHLPGRVPEISDPIYIIILAVVLRLLDSAADRNAQPRPQWEPV